jgi:hypothetical protein
MDVKKSIFKQMTYERIIYKATGMLPICRLICGLKQVENMWKHDLHGTILDFRYTRLRSVYCAYNLQDKEESSIIVVWVDDIVGIAST